MNSITLATILALIIYALKPDKKNEKKHCNTEFLEDEWEPVIPETGPAERPWSIEILSNKNNPVTQKLEAFSLN